jgi:type II secretory pathway pseudopilin PulG
MKKLGFTIIEILVALAISISALLATVSFGRQWWQRQQEAQFFADFERDWAQLRQMAIVDHAVVEMKWDYPHQCFSFGTQKHAGKAYVYLPKSLSMALPNQDSQWSMEYSGGNFTKEQTLIFYRRNSTDQVIFTWQMGSGVLLRHDT